MNFDFNDEQKMLRDQARRFLQEACTSADLRSAIDAEDGTFAKALWQQVVELGWTAVAVPESCGGLGLGALELAVLAEEFGRVLAPLPFLSTAVLAPLLLTKCAQPQAVVLLERIAAGEVIVAVGCLELPEPTLTYRDGVIHGQAVVAFGLQADVLLLPARTTDGMVVVLVDASAPGLQRTPQTSIDELVPMARIEGEAVSATLLLSGAAAANAWQQALRLAAVVCSFEQIGGADRSIEISRDYALERFTFGRPIGSYQAVKHRLADMAVKVELARSNAWYAAWALVNNTPELPTAAATARISALDAHEFAALESLHLHGGIGYTWESDCHLHYKRARLLTLLLGDTGTWCEHLLSCLTQHPTTA